MTGPSTNRESNTRILLVSALRLAKATEDLFVTRGLSSGAQPPIGAPIQDPHGVRIEHKKTFDRCGVPPIVAFYDQQGLLRAYSSPGSSIRCPHPRPPREQYIFGRWGARCLIVLYKEYKSHCMETMLDDEFPLLLGIKVEVPSYGPGTSCPSRLTNYVFSECPRKTEKNSSKTQVHREIHASRDHSHF